MRQKGKALLFLMLIKSETKKRCKGKASNRIQLSGSKEVKGALFLLQYHLFRGFEMFLNSWHSRVINWKWNRNLKGLFLWCFHSQHGSVQGYPIHWQTSHSYIVQVRVSTSIASDPVQHFTHTNTQTCSSGTLSAPQVIEECAYRTCVPNMCSLCTGMQKLYAHCDNPFHSYPFYPH